MKVLVAGGGTAGHVNPAIALALALQPAEVTFLGTDRGVETKLVPAAGFALRTIDVRGFDRARPWMLLSVGARAAAAVAEARSAITSARPDVIVGMGGYVSLPACVAASLARVPVVLHEQNIVFGLANKVSKPLARSIGVSFEETLERAGRRGVHTGNPVLPQIAELDVAAARERAYERFGLDRTRRTLLVFGGSLGAQRVNQAAAGLAHLWRDRSDRQVLHITGAAALTEVSAAVVDTGDLVYRAMPYVEQMGEAYAVADLALCRGGATTVAELGVLGVASVIVPYPYHRDQQQLRHGRVLEKRGAAVVLPDAETTPERVHDVVGTLIDDPRALASMRAAARGFGRPDAAAALARVVTEAAA